MKLINILIILIVFSNDWHILNSQSDEKLLKTTLAKFEPKNGEILFFIGQDLEAIGGLDSYNEGYCNFFDMPTGFTSYTSLSPGDESFGFTNKGNDGIKSIANWGAGDNCAQCILDGLNFKHSLVSIGLSLVNHEKNIAKGQHDNLIIELGNWIKSLGKRPVFLRIGYEFDGWDWNHYKKKHYLKAWKRIKTIFEDLNVTNVALVWQSIGVGSNQEILEQWYPGDDVVDWCGYSYFGNPDQGMLTFARKHNKPVFIAEAAPVFEQDNLYFDTRLTNPEIAKRAWTQWFVPFFETISNNRDVIKAFSYINVNWSAQAMWITNPTFKQVDSRIQVNDTLSKKWINELTKLNYLKPSPKLWELLDPR